MPRTRTHAAAARPQHGQHRCDDVISQGAGQPLRHTAHAFGRRPADDRVLVGQGGEQRPHARIHRIRHGHIVVVFVVVVLVRALRDGCRRRHRPRQRAAACGRVAQAGPSRTPRL
jgi:heme A synthase